MKTLLELDVTPEEMAAVTDVLRSMNITFRSQTESEAFTPGGSEAEIREAVQTLKTRWDDRWATFEDFRQEAWGGR